MGIIKLKKYIKKVGYNPLLDRDALGVVKGPFLIPFVDVVEEEIEVADTRIIKEGDLPTFA